MTCLHPIVVDEKANAGIPWIGSDWWRTCAMCEVTYNRTVRVLAPLRAHCDQAWGINFTKFKLDDEDALEIAG